MKFRALLTIQTDEPEYFVPETIKKYLVDYHPKFKTLLESHEVSTVDEIIDIVGTRGVLKGLRISIDEDIDIQLPFTFPDGISKLKTLKNLMFTDANISTLPAGIGELTGLKGLHIKYCPLVSLPAEIGKLKNLKYLTVSRTKITDLPNEMIGLKSLVSMYLSFNCFTTKPDVLFDMVKKLYNLEFINLNGYEYDHTDWFNSIET